MLYPLMRRLLVLLCLLPIVAQAEVSVVTSIRPLYQITAALMQGVGEPELLIKKPALGTPLRFPAVALQIVATGRSGDLDRSPFRKWTATATGNSRQKHGSARITADAGPPGAGWTYLVFAGIVDQNQWPNC